VNRRRPRLVDRKFQLGLAWRMMIAFLVFFLGGLVIVFAPPMYRLATGSTLPELESAAAEFLVLHHRVWPAVLFIFGGVFIYTLAFSRRIAGPVYRINSVLRLMLEGGRPEKVTLRRGDFFHDTVDLLDQLSRKTAGEQGRTERGKDEPREPAGK
jgi:hypothetical protein